MDKSQSSQIKKYALIGCIVAIVIIGVVLLIIVIIGSYYSSKDKKAQSDTTSVTTKQPTNTTSPTTSSPTTVQENGEQEAKKIVDNFYSVMKEQAAEATMVLFSNPETSEEAEYYDFLMGVDVDNIPRLYTTASLGNFKLESHKIIDTQKDSDSKITFQITETKQYYDNTTGNWSSSKNINKAIVMKKIGNEWKIDKYYYQDPNQKYGGFEEI